MRLHLLAAEPAAHPQALDGDLVAAQAQHVGDDLLRLGRVLGAALDEHLPGLVDDGQGGVRLEVEVLLPGHLGDPAEHVGRLGEAALDVAALDRGTPALVGARHDRLGEGEHRGQRLVVDLHRRGAEPCCLQGFPQHPGHGLPVEHHGVGEQRLVVLGARVVGAGHVGGGEHALHARHGQRRGRVEAEHPRVGVGRGDGVGVEHVGARRHQVVGVERVARDVQAGALVRQGAAHDDALVGTAGQLAHRPAPPPAVVGPGSCDSAHSRRSALPSMALR